MEIVTPSDLQQVDQPLSVVTKTLDVQVVSVSTIPAFTPAHDPQSELLVQYDLSQMRHPFTLKFPHEIFNIIRFIF